MTGLTAVPYLLAASYLAPKIGVGLFLAALIAGQLGGGVVLDHFGVLGTATRPIDANPGARRRRFAYRRRPRARIPLDLGEEHQVGESSFDRWANVLVDYSTEIKTGDQVAISGGVAAEPLLRAIYRAVLRNGGHAVLMPSFSEAQTDLFTNASDEQLAYISPARTLGTRGSDRHDRRPGQHQHASALRGRSLPASGLEPRADGATKERLRSVPRGASAAGRPRSSRPLPTRKTRTWRPMSSPPSWKRPACSTGPIRSPPGASFRRGRPA